jgi:hypothetical protein
MKYLYLLFFVLTSASVFSQEIFDCQHLKNSGLNTKSLKNISRGENSRSDTFDILKYTINLDITGLQSQTIKGSCIVSFVSRKNNIQALPLDLLKLNVDSVLLNLVKLTFNYNDTLLSINLPNTFNTGDTGEVQVFYHGNPQKDSQWGGFYFESGYAYNLGVGFAANPHNFGRVWFPCFDNFIERSKYEFNILTSQGKKAFCNGALVSEIVVGADSVIRKWVLEEEIPTYLASVAVGSYTSVEYLHQGNFAPVPIVLAALPNDTNNLKISFQNLGKAIDAFEEGFAPHMWNKVGFSLVPFNSGAMEHATNIAYPRAAANGTLNNETLMAHELAHHWWGDYLTCETAEDMWINEGWAKFSEHLFLEKVYGPQKYKEEVAKNHDFVLQYIHKREGGYWPVSGVPHHLTYSDHVYKKGASVAHSLRGYLSDSHFFGGIQGLFDSLKFTHINSHNLRDALSAKTGYNLTDFFEDFVFQPGFAHFSIDSFIVTPTGAASIVKAYVRQRLRGATHFYNNTPITFTFLNSSFGKHEEVKLVGGEFSTLTFSVPFLPDFVALNMDNQINQAISSNHSWTKSTGNISLPLGRVNLEVSNVSDSALVFVEHNWVGPDPLNVEGLKISPQRYWRIDGIWKNDFQSKARFAYDGRNTGTSQPYLDNELIGPVADSIVFLFRKDASEAWHEHPSYEIKPTGISNSRTGNIIVNQITKGEYALAYGNKNVLVANIHNHSIAEPIIYPNPANKILQIDLGKAKSFEIEIMDLSGRLTLRTAGNNGRANIDVSLLPRGIYLVKISSDSVVFKKLILN